MNYRDWFLELERRGVGRLKESCMLDDIRCFLEKKDVAETFLADGLEKILADVKILYVGGDVKKRGFRRAVPKARSSAFTIGNGALMMYGSERSERSKILEGGGVWPPAENLYD